MNLSRFAKYAWGVLGLNIIVILWGAVVKATGSGAGCGEHWPMCNGLVVPRAPAVDTLIEFTHRMSSGLALLSVAGLLIWAFRAFPPGHHVRRGAVASAALIIIESLLGAALVLFGWTAFDKSLARVIMQPIHLTNTLLLLAAVLYTARAASGGAPLELRGQGWRPGLFLAVRSFRSVSCFSRPPTWWRAWPRNSTPPPISWCACACGIPASRLAWACTSSGWRFPMDRPRPP